MQHGKLKFRAGLKCPGPLVQGYSRQRRFADSRSCERWKSLWILLRQLSIVTGELLVNSRAPYSTCTRRRYAHICPVYVTVVCPKSQYFSMSRRWDIKYALRKTSDSCHCLPLGFGYILNFQVLYWLWI